MQKLLSCFTQSSSFLHASQSKQEEDGVKDQLKPEEGLHMLLAGGVHWALSPLASL